MRVPLPLRLSPILCQTFLLWSAEISPSVAAPQKMIIDTDFNTIDDDGQVLVMAAQLQAMGALDILGLTIPTGNQWRDQEVSDALKAVERLGIRNRVTVHPGAQYPLLHDYQAYLHETKLRSGSNYVGAYANPPAEPSQIVPPPDGFATQTQASPVDAVDFLIQSAHRYPHEITLLAIGPLTNVALAIRKGAAIVPLFKRLVIMGGQIDVGGNAFNDAAEFNWWMDPEAAQIVLRSGIPLHVVPLDCTNTVPLTKQIYDRVVNTPNPTIITKIYEKHWAPFFGTKPPPYVPYIYDTVALAYAYDPTFAKETEDRWIEINTSFGGDYGRAIGFRRNSPTGHLAQSVVIKSIDNPRFYDFYVDLLTRPVPVPQKGQ
jgi:purine nucleosidase